MGGLNKMKKNFVLMLAMLGLFFTFNTSLTYAAANGNNGYIMKDGKILECGQTPYIAEETTMVPMRVIFEVLGADVDWNEAIQKIVASKGENRIELTIGEKTAKIDGQNAILNTAPVVYNGTTMVPLRFVAEALQAQVDYDSKREETRLTVGQEVLYIVADKQLNSNIANASNEFLDKLTSNAWDTSFQTEKYAFFFADGSGMCLSGAGMFFGLLPEWYEEYDNFTYKVDNKTNNVKITNVQGGVSDWIWDAKAGIFTDSFDDGLGDEPNYITLKIMPMPINKFFSRLVNVDSDDIVVDYYFKNLLEIVLEYCNHALPAEQYAALIKDQEAWQSTLNLNDDYMLVEQQIKERIKILIQKYLQ